MYNLSMADDSISPEKFVVDGYPAVSAFPKTHPNKQNVDLKFKDEL